MYLHSRQEIYTNRENKGFTMILLLLGTNDHTSLILFPLQVMDVLRNPRAKLLRTRLTCMSFSLF